jgi:hypothetical protein
LDTGPGIGLRPVVRMIGPLACALVMAASVTGVAGTTAVQASGCTPTNYGVAAHGAIGGIYLCTPGTHRTLGQGPFFSISDRIPNRVWLRQNPDGSGWSDCFQSTFPRTFTLRGRDREPGSILVGPSTSRCP